MPEKRVAPRDKEMKRPPLTPNQRAELLAQRAEEAAKGPTKEVQKHHTLVPTILAAALDDESGNVSIRVRVEGFIRGKRFGGKVFGAGVIEIPCEITEDRLGRQDPD